MCAHACLSAISACAQACAAVGWTTRPPRPLLRQKPLHAVAPRARIAFVHDAPSFIVLDTMAGLLPGGAFGRATAGTKWEGA